MGKFKCIDHKFCYFFRCKSSIFKLAKNYVSTKSDHFWNVWIYALHFYGQHCKIWSLSLGIVLSLDKYDVRTSHNFTPCYTSSFSPWVGRNLCFLRNLLLLKIIKFGRVSSVRDWVENGLFLGGCELFFACFYKLTDFEQPLSQIRKVMAHNFEQ